jgi:hypothetical protein
MKTIIKSTAIFFASALLSTAVFAAGKPNDGPEPATSAVSFTAIAQDCGVAVIVHKTEKSPAAITITDAEGNVLLNDHLSDKPGVVQKGFSFDELTEGDYTIKVTINNEVTQRVVHVYNDDSDIKTFFFKM